MLTELCLPTYTYNWATQGSTLYWPAYKHDCAKHDPMSYHTYLRYLLDNGHHRWPIFPKNPIHWLINGAHVWVSSSMFGKPLLGHHLNHICHVIWEWQNFSLLTILLVYRLTFDFFDMHLTREHVCNCCKLKLRF